MILIALGSNLPSRYGVPHATILAAFEQLQAIGIQILATSSIWLTAPVPASSQPDYANAVTVVKTSLQPDALLALLHAVEADFGRVRECERNAARILDLDILAYNDVRVEGDDMQIPHPRMHMRGFVLFPLQEVAPDWHHPVLGLSISSMIAGLPEDQILTQKIANAA